MTAQELAYNEIEKLITNFKNIPASQRRGMNEMQTRLGYILPLFRSLGWDTSNINEVSPEEKVSRGWVDFSFRIGNVPRFFLETKKVNENLNDPKWVKQAIDYAWTKSVTWALLSDFEGLKVFNAEWQSDNPFQSVFIEFDLDTYLSDFERLWWLSRSETEVKRLDKEAERWGKRSKRQPVSQHLFDNLKRWRGLLHNDYKKFNSLLAAEADSIVLRLLNRLIFIRTAEDREVEQVRLRSLIRELESQRKFAELPAELSRLFREFDKTYNSELFAPHALDGAYATPTNLKEVIEGLYGTKYLTYNFNALESDVLGTAYEQYLGSIMTAESPDKKQAQPYLLGEEVLEVKERRQKRKSQGIYYTPTFVTKYIVQQTVGKYLDEHGYNPSHPPRVLDMACGSGSFLIEAFDVIDDFVAKQRGHAQKGEVDFYDRLRQLEVLQNCIFGVDKDKQAVEVARLNLLLRGLHSREKLPMLENIAHGDSLHPETFETNFSQIMKEDGFDVIVGNPPYVRQETLGEEFKAFAKQNFETYAGTADLYIYFIEQAHKLLKPGGYFGMIVSNKWMRSNYGKVLREFLKRESQLVEIIDFGELPVFGEIIAYPVILIFQKNIVENQSFTYAPIERLDFNSLSDEIKVVGSNLNQSILLSNGWSLSTSNRQELLNRIRERGEKLGDYVQKKIYFGIKTGYNEAFYIDKEKKDSWVSTDSKYKELVKPILMGRNVHEYFLDFDNKWLIVIPKGWTRANMQVNNSSEGQAWNWLGENYPLIAEHLQEYKNKAKERQDMGEYWWELRACEYYPEFEKAKMIAPTIVDHATFALDTEKYYSNDKTTIIGSQDLYVLGILNSRISDFVFKSISSTKQGGYFEQKPMYISQLPIRRIDFGNLAEKLAHYEIVRLVEKMLALQKERQSVRREDDLDRVRNLERQIAQVDEEIDKQVYALYGLTEDEIKVVEGM